MKQKFLVAGFVVALLVGGISLDALASSNEGSSGSKQGVLVAANKKVKKAKKAKKAKKPKMQKDGMSSKPGAVSVHDTDFVLKCGINGDKTFKAGSSDNDLYRFNCISDDLTSMWKEEFANAATYPDAEIQKRTGAKPVVLETNKNNGSIKYRYTFSGNTFLKSQGDRFEGDSKCWHIDMWDDRKGGGAGGKTWSISDVNQGSNTDDCADRITPQAPAETPVATAPVGPAVSDHTADITLKCGAKDIVLQFVDTPDQVKDGIWQLHDKREECVQGILDAWRADFNYGPGKTYPEPLMKQKLAVSPVTYRDEFYADEYLAGRKDWKFYFNGDSILKALGDKFAPADKEGSGLKGPSCYLYSLVDHQKTDALHMPSYKWITSWRENGSVADNPTCGPKS